MAKKNKITLQEYLDHQKIFTADEVDYYYNYFLDVNDDDRWGGLFKVSEIFVEDAWMALNNRKRRALGRFFKLMVEANLLDKIFHVPGKSKTNIYMKKFN